MVERKFTTSFTLCRQVIYNKIHHAFEGDTFFPEIDMTNWKEIFVEKGLTDEKTHIRIITMYMRNNNNKKIDVRIRINLFIIFTNISL